MSILTDIKKTLYLLLQDKITKSTPLEDLTGKVVVITGASKGLGKAIAEYLHSEGCKLALLSRDLEELKKAFSSGSNTSNYSASSDPNTVSSKNKFSNSKTISLNNEDILLIEGDISKSETADKLITETIKKFGKIDVLINNAGIFIEKSLEESTDSDINNIINTNVKGMLYLSRAAIPFMKGIKSATIINIGSKISHNPNIKPKKVLYAASKYAVEGLSYALNKELHPYGIRVVCLMPGTMNTFISVKSGNYMSPQRVAQVIGMIIKFHDIDFEGFVIKSVDQSYDD